MLNKSDCLSILVKMEDKGIDIGPYMRKLAISKDIPIDVLQFIAQNQGIEVGNFYEMLRKKHNEKKSQLYISIIKEKDAEQDIITTLSCLLQQIVLYSSKLTHDKEQFLKEVRAEEITRVLNDYFKTGSVISAMTVLSLVKNDLLVIEGLNGRRSFE